MPVIPVLLFGVLSWRRMSTGILPRVDRPEIIAVCNYNDLNAAEMAAKLTSFSESAILNNVDDRAEVRSETSNGVALVKLRLPNRGLRIPLPRRDGSVSPSSRKV